MDISTFHSVNDYDSPLTSEFNIKDSLSSFNYADTNINSNNPWSDVKRLNYSSSCQSPNDSLVLTKGAMISKLIFLCFFKKLPPNNHSYFRAT